jgi:hypothetical protein
MKPYCLLFALALGCGARVDAPVGEPPPATTPPTSASELLRTENPMCAFGASAGHLVWIDATTKQVSVARANPGSAARVLGIAADTCALAVKGTRFCFGDSGGSLSCMNVDGSAYEIHGDRLTTDPVRSVDLGPDRGLIFARRRTVYGRLYDASFDVRTMPNEIVATAGDFEPSPDDGVEWAVLTRNALQRMSYGESAPVAVSAPIAVRALQYSSYLVLSSDGVLSRVHAGDGGSAPLDLGSVQRFATRDRWDGENLVVARAGEIVAVEGRLFFEPHIEKTRVVVPTEGDVVAIALDEDEILWATTAGEIRRAR